MITKIQNTLAAVGGRSDWTSILTALWTSFGRDPDSRTAVSDKAQLAAQQKLVNLAAAYNAKADKAAKVAADEADAAARKELTKEHEATEKASAGGPGLVMN